MCTSFISIIGDDVIEMTEMFRVSLIPLNTDITVTPDVFVTILDDDRKLFFFLVLSLAFVNTSDNVLRRGLTYHLSYNYHSNSTSNV